MEDPSNEVGSSSMDQGNLVMSGKYALRLPWGRIADLLRVDASHVCPGHGLLPDLVTSDSFWWAQALDVVALLKHQCEPF